ncbi:hypothetical protein PNOK_0154900 [Pyrrhoderma noxium]|uniref:Uncharacterized protein n=1 Tax=Pyrrhoderma noxium TaxID=2282107 RepID=A0A286UPT6_9AGAM|nr:hypothetical protein PNOK_0154900 [Pyrrhoderma noxium]
MPRRFRGGSRVTASDGSGFSLDVTKLYQHLRISGLRRLVGFVTRCRLKLMPITLFHPRASICCKEPRRRHDAQKSGVLPYRVTLIPVWYLL